MEINNKIMYRPTYQCPPKANANIISQISKLSTLSTTLDEALTDLIQESKSSKGEGIDLRSKCSKGNDVSDASSISSEEQSCTKLNTSNDDDGCENPSKKIVMDDTFKNYILQKLHEAHADITWQNQQTLQLPTVSNQKENHNKNQTKEPPAALLHGKLKYYNRVNGQWRIVVSNAVLRPRVNIDYRKKNRKRNRTSLWDQSKEQSMDIYTSLDGQSKRMRNSNDDDNIILNGNDIDKLQMDFPINDDGGINLDGDLVILAYDDVIE